MRYLCAILLVLAGLWLAPGALADEGEAILGVWVSEDGRGHIEIAKEADQFVGKIVWLSEPNYPADDPEPGKPRHDRNNPDSDKQARPILGLEVLKGFRYDGDGKWSGGTIYDPDNGKTYKCKMTLEGADTLKVRGFIGVSVIGRTAVWTRYKESASDQKAAAESGK